MYKVFINQQVLIFVSIDQFDNQFINKKNVLVVTGNKINRANLAAIAKNNSHVFFILCKKVNTVWKNFKSGYQLVKAGGGLVLNNKKEMLFIYRRGKWDLPKGKQDKGESMEKCALREVKEECGLKKLKLVSPATKTWHVYQAGKKNMIKQTNWYWMKTQGKQKLVPQVKEDITKLGFVSRQHYTRFMRKNTYPLIDDIVNHIPENIF
jgi:hypothetical protein